MICLGTPNSIPLSLSLSLIPLISSTHLSQSGVGACLSPRQAWQKRCSWRPAGQHVESTPHCLPVSENENCSCSKYQARERDLGGDLTDEIEVYMLPVTVAQIHFTLYKTF